MSPLRLAEFHGRGGQLREIGHEPFDISGEILLAEPAGCVVSRSMGSCLGLCLGSDLGPG